MVTTGRFFISGVIAVIATLPIIAISMPQQMTVYGVVLTAIIGLTALGHRSDWGFNTRRLFDPLLIGLLVFLGYAAITTLWSVDEGQTIQRSFRLTWLVVLGYFGIHCSTHIALRNSKLAWVVAASVLILFGLIVIELFTGILAGSVWRDAPERTRDNLLNRPAMILCLAIWPALLVLWYRRFRGFTIFLGLSLPVALFFTSSVGAFLAAAIGSLVWAIAFFHARLCAWLIGGAFAVATMAAPFLALNVPLINSGIAFFANYGSISGAHRLAIWHFVATMIKERSLFGWGLDSARNIPHADLPLASVPSLSKVLVLEYPTIANLPASQALPLHPHNAGLQITLETGAVGAAIFCVLVLFLALRLTAEQNRAKAPFALASLASWLVITGLNVGIWQSWWLMSSIVTMFFYSLSLRSDDTKKTKFFTRNENL